MKYRIDIKGMHCTGCETLIKMSLEEEKLENITVSLKENTATFETLKSQDTINDLLNKIFSELQEYSYSNLKLV